MAAKRVDYSLITCLVSLVIGLVMVLWPGMVADYLVFAVGLLFLIPGAVSIVMYYSNKKKYGSMHFPYQLSGVGSVLFGLLLMIVPSFFANMITFVLGLSIALGGLFQIVQLYHAREWTKVSLLAYILPIMIFILGIVMLFNPSEAKETTFFIMGIGILFYTLTCLINWFAFTRKRPKNNILGGDIDDATVVEE